MSRWTEGLVGLVLSVPNLTACGHAGEVNLQPSDDRYQACAERRAPTTGESAVSFAAIVLRIEDATPVDGPVKFVLVRGGGARVRAEFGSLFTRPAPSAERQATYRNIARTREGDCVYIKGRPTSEGIWIETFVNLGTD